MNAKFMKFLIIALVVNTVLFTLAMLSKIPVWKVVLAEVIVFFLLVAWKAWRSPAQQLGNQGTSMGWNIIGMVRDEEDTAEKEEVMLPNYSLNLTISHAEQLPAE